MKYWISEFLLGVMVTLVVLLGVAAVTLLTAVVIKTIAEWDTAGKILTFLLGGSLVGGVLRVVDVVRAGRES
jgi:hypothetical protein